MSDDHAMQAISAYGHPVSQLAPTPNIDRLAEQGALFTANYCGNSISKKQELQRLQELYEVPEEHK